MKARIRSPHGPALASASAISKRSCLWSLFGAILIASALAGCGGGSSSAPANPLPTLQPTPSSDPLPTVPTITTQPSNQSVIVGHGATFTVVASGSGLSYQWKRNAADIPGAKAATYTTPNATLADSGVKYSVQVTNTAGSVSSQSATLLVDAAPTGTTYYLDAVHGSDTTGDGSQTQPYQTVAAVWPHLKSGDSVELASGNYAKFVAGRTGPDDQGWNQRAADVFTDWVTFRAGTGQDPHIASLDLGTWSGSDGKAVPFSVLGLCDVYLRFEGLSIDDGASLICCRHVELRNCRIQRAGDITGSDDNLNKKTGVTVINGRYITLDGNEITHVAMGIWAMTTDFVVRNNEIHHNSHDGINMHGGENWLIEGNRIHDLDDGVDDSGSWGMHVDGIQIYFIYGSEKYATQFNNLTMRGNTFYHLEAMGIMVNASNPPANNYRNWIFENNVMGPVGGNLLHWGARIEGFIFRHNSIVYTPTTTWDSMYRKGLDASRYNVAWWPDGDGKQIYNNIFVDGKSSQPDPKNTSFALVANNLYKTAPSSPLERGSALITTLPYAPGDWTATLLTGSQAIDAGTRLGADFNVLANQLDIDINGNPRDNRPDIGAYEVQGRNPTAETAATYGH